MEGPKLDIRIPIVLGFLGVGILQSTALGQWDGSRKKQHCMVRPAVSLVGPARMHVSLHFPSGGQSSILSFAEEYGIELAPLEEIQLPFVSSPKVASAGATPPGPLLPPGAGRGIPSWLRSPAPPGFWFTEPPILAVSNPDWIEALRLHIAINQAQIDRQTRESVELPWVWLSSRQQELFSQAEKIDLEWAAIAPGVRAAVNAYVDGYWVLKRDVDAWQSDLSQYNSYCTRSVPPEEVERAMQECREMQSALNSRTDRFREREGGLLAAFEQGATVPTALIYGRIQTLLQEAEYWNGKVVAYNASVLAALQSPRRDPTASECQTAIKILMQYERLAQKFGIKIPPGRLAELNRLRDTGEIRKSHLPGTLQGEFPGVFGDMTLAEIQEACRGTK